MKILRRIAILPLALASLSATLALRGGEFVVDDGSSDSPPASAGKIVLVNQSGQPRLKVFASANPSEKPQPQAELKDSEYTVNLSDPAMEVSLYVTTMDNKRKSAIRRAKDGDVLAVVFEDGHLAILKRRSSRK